MARVKLRYDEQVEVDGMDEIRIHFIVKDLPEVCLRCGKPATELVELDFFNHDEGRMATVHAPLCKGHPLMGMTTIILVICFLLSLPVIAVAALLSYLLPSDFWVPLFFPLITILWIIGVGVKIVGAFADIDTEQIEANGVELKGVSPEFVAAYRKFRKARERHEDQAVFGISRTGLGEEGAALAAAPSPRQQRPPRLRLRKKRAYRDFFDLLQRPAFYAAMGAVVLVGMSCFGVATILHFSEKKPKWWGAPNRGGPNPTPPAKVWPAVEKFTPEMPNLPAPPPSPQPLPGVIAYWPLDLGIGQVVMNVGEPNRLGSLQGAEWLQGVRQGALWFNGQSAYVDLGDSPTLNFAAGQPFTVAGWVATKETAGTIVSFRNSEQAGADIDVQVSGGKLVGFVRADGSEFGVASVKGPVINDGKWHHFALSRHADGLIELFLDGQSQSQGRSPRSGGAITTNLRAIGSERYWVRVNWNQENPYLGGAVDEVCVFRRVLTPEELASLAGQRK
jgi:hypothetical protein